MVRLVKHSFLLLALLALPAVAEGAEDQMFTARSKHYEVRSDVSQRFAQLVSQHMESIYGEYMRRFRDYGLRDAGVFNVVVYAKKDDYDASVPRPLIGSAGAFISVRKLLAAWRGERSDEEVFRTLYHEGFHQFLFTTMPHPVPIWVNEGFAEYFAEATWNGRSFTTGRVPYMRLFVIQKALKDGEHIPLSDLFAMSDQDWMDTVGADQNRANIQYCEAWSVVHFLAHAQGGRHRARILSYLKQLSEGEDRDKAFKRSFGSDARAFERAWAGYVRDLKPTPDEICRKNLEVILFLALSYYRDPARFTSLESFAADVLNTGRMTWEVTAGDGDKISSADRERVRSLFTCPYDKRRHGISYVLVRDPKTSLPMVFCGYHAGIVYKAHCVPREEGGYRVYVEQVVRETMPPDLVKLLRAQNK